MLVSVVSHFSKTWSLLYLEILQSHGLSSLLVSGNPAVSLLLLHVVFVSRNPAFSLDEWPSSPEGGSIFVIRCILIG